MRAFQLIMALGLATAAAQSLPAQTDATKLVEFDDGFSSYVYAYIRAETNPIANIDELGSITFDRDPVLMITCVNGAVVVVYRFDAVLAGHDGAVRVQYRFLGQPASESQPWPLIADAASAAETDIAIAMLTGQSEGANPLAEMMANMGLAARVPEDRAVEFLAGAEDADQVTLRVTDPMDGEEHTDVFGLVGFSDSARTMRERCD